VAIGPDRPGAQRCHAEELHFNYLFICKISTQMLKDLRSCG